MQQSIIDLQIRGGLNSWSFIATPLPLPMDPFVSLDSSFYPADHGSIKGPWEQDGSTVIYGGKVQLCIAPNIMQFAATATQGWWFIISHEDEDNTQTASIEVQSGTYHGYGT